MAKERLPKKEELEEIEKGKGDNIFSTLPPKRELERLHRLVFGYENIQDYIGNRT